MSKLFFSILIFQFFIFFQPEIGEANFAGGTYYLYEFGNNDYYSIKGGGDGTWTSETKLIFDGAGNFSAQTLADSESDNDSFSGTYIVKNGVLNISVEGEALDFRIAPDGETLANVTALQSQDPEIDNETLRILIKGSNVSGISGTYYLYEFGNNDYYSIKDGGDGTWTSEIKFTFDGAGNFAAQTLADSESDNDSFSGTYIVKNGVLNISVEGEDMDFRIAPDGEIIANVTALQSQGPEIDNESLRILIKGSNVSSISGTYYLYEFGNNDYYSIKDGGDGTWTSETKLIFDGAGNFAAQTLADSESDNGSFNGTYMVANGVLNISVGGGTMAFRIAPDGETLANVTALQNEGPEIDNEVLRFLVKESKKITLSSLMLLL